MAAESTPREPVLTRTYKRGVEARERIIDAALEQFGRRGYWGASLQDIADNVGMSKAGLMHHFPTKEALLAAVLAEADERDRFRVGVADLYNVRGLAVFDALDRLIETNSQRRELVQLGHVIRAEAAGQAHTATAASKEHFEIARGIIMTALIAGIEDGEVRSDTDCQLIALQAVATMEGLENQWLTDPSIDLVSAYHSYTAELRIKLRADRT